MEEVKLVLENLNIAVASIQESLERTDKKEKEQEAQQLKLDKAADDIKAKTQELDQREKKIKQIEDIEKATQDANDLTAEANKEKDALQKSVDEHEAKKIADRKKQEEEWKLIADADLMNKKQAEALIKERKVFEEKYKIAKTVLRA